MPDNKFTCSDASLIVFESDDYLVRAIGKDGIVYFSLDDISKILNFTNLKNIINTILLDDEYTSLDSKYFISNSNDKLTFITEDGLYNLIYVSRSSSVLPFKQWIKNYINPYLKEYYTEYMLNNTQ